MSRVSLGRIQVVNPKEVWRNEEYDFTPWLAENAEALSEVIGIPITIEQTEKRVGSFELDIYGTIENTDKKVVIENQLDMCDHKHLGQLITYAAGLDASIIIWVAAQVRDEYVVAIEWLNKVTQDDVSFFLVRPEVIRIDDSQPAVRFQLEAGPSDFIKGIRTTVEGEEAPRHSFRRHFWAEMFEYLADDGHPWAKGRRTTRDSWVTSPVGKSGVCVYISMAQGSRIRIEIGLNHDSLEQTKAWYNKLLDNKTEIEDLFRGQEVSWEPLEGAKSSRVAIYTPYDKQKAESDKNYREGLFHWISINTKVMREIAIKYLVQAQS